MSRQQDFLVNKIINIYRKLSRIPQPKSAHIDNTSTKSRTSVRTQWSQRDLERSENVTFVKNYVLSSNGKTFNVDYRSVNTGNSNELWNRESPSGKWRAIATKFTPKKGDDKYFIEIWDNNFRHRNVDLLAQEKHGKLYEPDVTFACFEWSPSDKYILYIAEKKLPKTVSYFDTKASSKKDETEETVRGTEHDFKMDWGEQLVGKHKSVLCMLDVDTGDVKVLDDLPGSLFPGQGIWGPSEKDILFTGWETEPYRLGVIYCPIRDSSVYHVDTETGNLTKISEVGRAARSPCFNPDKSKLIYLDTDIGGPHMQCSRLMMFDWSKQNIDTVIDIVWDSKGEDFTGINTLEFPHRCWSADGKRIVMHTCWRRNNALIVVNTETKSVTRMFSDHKGNCTVLDVHMDKLVVQCSSPNTPPYLCIGNLPGEGKESRIELDCIDGEPYTEMSLKWEIMKHTPTEDRANPKYGIQEYESIFLHPETSSTDTKPPLVLFPHGGPHSSFTTDYSPYALGMSLCGFAVLMVNYRGSQGYGENCNRSLPGLVGDQDVKDVKAAADELIQSGKVDGDRMVAFGGSHGGFLVTHLIGQYSGLFKAACARNPVTNIPCTFASSDDPDWSYYEVGHDFSHLSLPKEDVLRDAWKKSPLQYVDQVKTPLIIMLGADDLRCPPSMGKEYYKALKARGVNTRLIVYEGNCHPIIKVDAEADAFVNILDWFTKHLNITDIHV